MEKRAADILVESLINQDVSCIFGVPGESYLSVLDALYNVEEEIQFITTRHESGASFMAEAYGKLTQTPGICFVTRGPGATNASIGVHSAMQNSTPMILFIGQISRNTTDREAFQEIDYRQFFGSIAKWVTQIDDPDRIGELIGRAFSTACSGRPGPVVVALPEDMLRELTKVPAVHKIKPHVAQACPRDIAIVTNELTSARRPLIIAGGSGWSDQGRFDLQKFAEINNIPVACGFRNQDVIDNTSAAFIGDMSFAKPEYLQQAIKQADIILALNIRFGEVLSDSWSLFQFPHPTQRILHCHMSENEIGKIYHCAHGVVTDPNTLVAGLLQTSKANNDRDAYLSNLRGKYLDSQSIPTVVGSVNMAEICNYINTHADSDVIYTNGAGNFAIWSGRYLNYSADRRLIAPQSGAMGAGLPAALAAKALYKERQVICFAGDGDFQMNCNELGTAMQYGLNPIILIHNNGSYGTIRMHQEMRYPNRVSGTVLKNPDFSALAAAYEFGYAKVTTDNEFPRAFSMASRSPCGFIIELCVDLHDIAPHKVLGAG